LGKDLIVKDATMRTDRPSVDQSKDTVRIILLNYRVQYAANDFTNSKARALDSAIAKHLSTFAVRAPWGSPKKLIFQITDERRDPEKEQITSKAYQEMFRWRAGAAVRRLLRQLPLVVILVFVGVALLWASHRIEDFNWEENFKQTVAEAVRLGAWVSLWSATSLLFSTAYESAHNYMAFRRLAHIPIEFDYKSAGTSAERLKKMKRASAS
jgi:hypothetical protein